MKKPPFSGEAFLLVGGGFLITGKCAGNDKFLRKCSCGIPAKSMSD